MPYGAKPTKGSQADPFPYGSDADPVRVHQGVAADENMLGQEELADAEVNWSPSRKLQPKMEAVVVTGALATVIIAVLALAGVDIPQTLAVAWATLLVSAAGYQRTE
jgi:hypothetical protein